MGIPQITHGPLVSSGKVLEMLPPFENPHSSVLVHKIVKMVPSAKVTSIWPEPSHSAQSLGFSPKHLGHFAFILDFLSELLQAFATMFGNSDSVSLAYLTTFVVYIFPVVPPHNHVVGVIKLNGPFGKKRPLLIHATTIRFVDDVKLIPVSSVRQNFKEL